MRHVDRIKAPENRAIRRVYRPEEQLDLGPAEAPLALVRGRHCNSLGVGG
jgi:hypothetical protein